MADCCNCFCWGTLLRYRPCCYAPADVLFFGDSAIEYMKYHVDWTSNCAVRDGWTALLGELGAHGMSGKLLACSGAPAYALCCVSPCVLLCGGARPKKAMVLSMGGNDIMWAPICGPHACCELAGCSMVSVYMRCFMAQLSCGPPIKIIWLTDHAVSLQFDRCRPCCGTDPYRRYVQRLRENAGIVVTPAVDADALARFLAEGKPKVKPGDEQPPVPACTYERVTHPGALYPDLILIDSEPLLTLAVSRESDVAKSGQLWRKLFEGVESSELLKLLWAQWILHVTTNEVLGSTNSTGSTVASVEQMAMER